MSLNVLSWTSQRTIERLKTMLCYADMFFAKCYDTGPTSDACKGRPGIIASQTLYYLNAFYHTCTLTTRSYICYLAPSSLCKEELFLWGWKLWNNVSISRTQRILNEALILNCCQRTHGSLIRESSTCFFCPGYCFKKNGLSLEVVLLPGLEG